MKLVPYLKDSEIELKAEKFLSEYHPNGELEVPIEEIIEFQFGIHIVPVDDLKALTNVDALISGDYSRIDVDRSVYETCETRLRFSVAHEIGHAYLHKEYLEKFKRENRINSIEEWQNNYRCLSDSVDHNTMEYQGNQFAASLLVPYNKLKPEMSILLPKLEIIETLKLFDFERDAYIGVVVDFVSRQLAPVFNVSPGVIVRRIEKTNLINLVP